MIKRIVKRIITRIIWGHKADSDAYVSWLRKQGVHVGERTVIFLPRETTIDVTRPWLINIGDDVQIAAGVTILTHGYDWSVLKGVYGDVLGSSGKVTIGNNVFIGMKSTILKGVSVGNNVIIGANSLVTHDIPDNCVAAGNPAKVIMGLEEYYQKRKIAQKSEAEELVREYRKYYGKEPNEEVMREFFWLFTNTVDNLPPVWHEVMALAGSEDLSYAKLPQNKVEFSNLPDFLANI